MTLRSEDFRKIPLHPHPEITQKPQKRQIIIDNNNIGMLNRLQPLPLLQIISRTIHIRYSSMPAIKSIPMDIISIRAIYYILNGCIYHLLCRHISYSALSAQIINCYH